MIDTELTERRKEFLRKAKKAPTVEMSILLIPLSLTNIISAIINGRVIYAGRFTFSQWISYPEHPIAFVFMILVSFCGIWLSTAMLYYKYKKFPDL
jgi:ABC-type multidrug transport system permease subunit